MLKFIKKFIYKTKQLWFLQKKVWKNKMERIHLMEQLKDFKKDIESQERKKEVEQDFINKLKDSHKYEDRQKVKRAKKKIEEIDERIEIFEKAISNPEAKNRKQLGLIQMIDIKTAAIQENKTLIRIVKEKL